jgi:hypothetical protein
VIFLRWVVWNEWGKLGCDPELPHFDSKNGAHLRGKLSLRYLSYVERLVASLPYATAITFFLHLRSKGYALGKLGREPELPSVMSYHFWGEIEIDSPCNELLRPRVWVRKMSSFPFWSEDN